MLAIHRRARKISAISRRGVAGLLTAWCGSAWSIPCARKNGCVTTTRKFKTVSRCSASWSRGKKAENHSVKAVVGRSTTCDRPSPGQQREISALSATRLLLAYRSEEHTSELQSLMRTSYAVFRLKKTITQTHIVYSPRIK